jgi:hypothetical protein
LFERLKSGKIKNKYMSDKCEKCLAYIGHHPECPNMDLQTAKKMVVEYYHAWLEQENKIRQAYKDAEKRVQRAKKEQQFWKGKYNEVKIENNALRRKLYNNEPKANREAEPNKKTTR